MNTMRDVLIIGAGPAGLMAARTLSEQGHDVVVLEEHPQVGTPVHCTGVLGFEAFDELDLPRQAICGVNQSAQVFASNGHSFFVESPRVQAAVVDRAVFDRAMADQAEVAGASLKTGSRVECLDIGPRGVRATVRDSGEYIDARVCVIACGAKYRFNRALGLGVPRAYLQSAQVEIPFPFVEHLEVYLGRAVAPSGFAWLVPFQRGSGTFAKIGLTCASNARQKFETYLRRITARHDAVMPTLPAPRLKILPLGPVQKTVADRVLVIGDAAGLVKPTTGGGIYYGALSGRMAAEVLDGALRQDALGEGSLRAYEASWRGRLGAEIRAGLMFRKVVSRLDDGAIESLVELARVDGLIPLLKRTANFNWHRSAALALLRHPPFRRIVLNSLWS